MILARANKFFPHHLLKMADMGGISNIFIWKVRDSRLDRRQEFCYEDENSEFMFNLLVWPKQGIVSSVVNWNAPWAVESPSLFILESCKVLHSCKARPFFKHPHGSITTFRGRNVFTKLICTATYVGLNNPCCAEIILLETCKFSGTIDAVFGHIFHPWNLFLFLANPMIF